MTKSVDIRRRCPRSDPSARDGVTTRDAGGSAPQAGRVRPWWLPSYRPGIPPAQTALFPDHPSRWQWSFSATSCLKRILKQYVLVRLAVCHASAINGIHEQTIRIWKNKCLLYYIPSVVLLRVCTMLYCLCLLFPQVCAAEWGIIYLNNLLPLHTLHTNPFTHTL